MNFLNLEHCKSPSSANILNCKILIQNWVNLCFETLISNCCILEMDDKKGPGWSHSLYRIHFFPDLTILKQIKRRRVRCNFLHRFALVCTGLHWFALVCTGLHWFTQVFTGLHRFLLVCTGLHWFAQVCTGLHRFAHFSSWHIFLVCTFF
jgi:hypothetical protein